MKKFILLITASLALAFNVSAQQAQQPLNQTPQTAQVAVAPTPDSNRQVVEIRLQNPPAPAPAPSQTVQNVSELVKTAQDFGAAIGGGLKNLAYETKDMTFGKDKTIVQGIDELSHTDAGKFTMAVIAWKVAGKDALELLKKCTGFLVGVPIQIFLVVGYIWVIRRFFLLRTVKVKETVNADKSKVIEYGVVNGDSYYKNNKTDVQVLNTINSDERHAGIFVATVLLLAISALNLGCVVF